MKSIMIFTINSTGTAISNCVLKTSVVEIHIWSHTVACGITVVKDSSQECEC